MLLLVLANNLVLTFVGWEGVGLCSYWLVSYYFERDAAASAGKKAFIYNRVGDVGMLVAMFLLFSRLHTLTYLTIFNARRHADPDDRDVRRLDVAARRDRQERADPALQLAARRHGGPDARVGADPRRHDGDRRGLPAGAHVTGARAVALRSNDHRGHRGRDGLRRRDHRHVAEGHQEGAGLLHDLPDRLHGARRGRRRLRRRDLLDDQPRLLQGAALPRFRLGHPLAQRRTGHAQDGRPPEVPAAHLPDVPDRLAGHLGDPALRRVLVQGRRPHQRLRTQQGALGPGRR